MDISHSHILLDACCILNFCASGRLLEILQVIPAQVTVAVVVQERELKTLQRLRKEENDSVNQFEIAITQGLLKIVDFESEEEAELFVNYVAVLGDDGESATCAIAIHRGWGIATDDKKAISRFQQDSPYLQILSTLDVIKYWSEKSVLDSSALRDILMAIRVKGRYLPHETHPLRNWWEAALNE